MGEMSDSLFNGKGEMHYSDGTIYKGEWKDGLWHGKGEVTYPDGDHYIGDFKLDKMEGEGTYSYANGAQYKGEWKDNKFNGKGELIYEDGGIYSGEWKDDMRHGEGMLYSQADNTIYNGYFEEDMFIYSFQNSTNNKEEMQTSATPQFLSVGFAVSFSNMFLFDIAFTNREHNAFWGLLFSTNTREYLWGTNSTTTDADGNTFIISDWYSNTNEEFIKGSFIKHNIMFQWGFYPTTNTLWGISIGGGIKKSYKNCVVMDNIQNIHKYSKYYKTISEGLELSWGSFIKSCIYSSEKYSLLLGVGYNNIDGLYIGSNLCF